jgi:hypothetical protein
MCPALCVSRGKHERIETAAFHAKLARHRTKKERLNVNAKRPAAIIPAAALSPFAEMAVFEHHNAS